MRVLIVSFYFPPYNVIGAVRVGKTAKYLWRAEHDVRVLTADRQGFEPMLQIELPKERVLYAPWFDVDRPYRAMVRLRNRLAEFKSNRASTVGGKNQRAAARASRFNSEGPQSEPRTVAWWFRLAYTDLLHFPDSARGWRSPAIAAARALIKEWRPDVILASGAPWTSFVVASELSRLYAIPWVADFRDLWSRNHTTFASSWRKRTIDAWYETRILRTASALITVSEPLAELLRQQHRGKPVEVILNGFDPDDLSEPTPARSGEGGEQTASPPSPVSGTTLRVVYTGEINRDLLPFLEAIRLMGAEAREIQVEIVGSQSESVRARYESIAESHGTSERIAWVGPVGHAEACSLQRDADLLLLLMHDSVEDAGVYTGKLFEYIGARRPILLAGTTSGVAAELIKARRLGRAEAAPVEIAAALRAWLNEKRTRGSVAAPQSAPIDDLSREAQTMAFANVLERVARS